MAFRQLLKSVIRNTRPIISPIMYAMAPLFVDSVSPQKPGTEQKLTLEPVNVDTLSYDYKIKQSTIDAVNAASQTLTITYSAIETTSRDYRIALTKLIVLIRETLIYEVCDSHWDMIVEVRAGVQLKKKIVEQLVGFMEYVHKMATAASETTYLAGMDNLSTTLCQRIDDALMKIQQEIDSNKELEDEYRDIQQQSILKSKKQDNSQDRQEESFSAQIQETQVNETIDPVSL